MSTIHQLSEYALDHAWRPIAWTRMFDQYVATIMLCPDETALYRVQDTTYRDPEIKGKAACLADAVDAIEKATKGKTLFSGAGGKL